jgi:hypothetical protein
MIKTVLRKYPAALPKNHEPPFQIVQHMRKLRKIAKNREKGGYIHPLILKNDWSVEESRNIAKNHETVA